MTIITDRLHLRKLQLIDAPFILSLVNEPGWLEYIGDRNIHSIKKAAEYIVTGPQAMYDKYGFGLLLVQDRFEKKSFGVCGLLQRAHLDAPDLGFALLGSAEGYGFAFEASHAILTEEFVLKNRKKLWAFTKPQNTRSQKLLMKLGFVEWKDDSQKARKESMYLNEGNSYR